MNNGGNQERLMEENRNLSMNLDILKQRCAKLELEMGGLLGMKQLAEKALQAENKGLVRFSSELRTALEAALAASNGDNEVHDSSSSPPAPHTLHPIAFSYASIKTCKYVYPCFHDEYPKFYASKED